MPREFTHLLLTRFNTAVGFAPSARRLENDWLEARLIPFEQYCLTSVAGQRGADFKWLIFLDAGSPAWLKEKFESFAPLVTSIYIDGTLTDEVVAGSVAATGLVNTPYLVTTRLDSDDALASTHLAMVQASFQRQEREFLVFPFGLQSYRGHLYNAFWPSNPFLSLIEKVQSDDRFTTVFCVPHDHVRSTGKVKSLIRAPQWLQIIHSKNTSSVPRGLPRLKSGAHPGFDVLWPEVATDDSLAKRAWFSVEAYSAWTGRFIGKAFARLKK
jgi:Putative rhamnosyl transferase